MAKRDPFIVDADPATNLPSFSSLEMRGILNSFQAGVIGPTDFKVTAGSGLTLDSAAGRATVQSSAGGVTFGGLYYVVDDTAENSATWERTGGGTGVPANASTNPRLDAVVLHTYDHSLDSSGRRAWVREYVPGTATGGAALGGTLPALPTSSLLIAEVLVPANNPSTIPSVNIRDRRPWAKGAYIQTLRNSGTTYQAVNTVAHNPIDSTNLSFRLECSGAPVRVMMHGIAAVSVAAVPASANLSIDGVLVGTGDLGRIVSGTANVASGFNWMTVVTPSAGSHVFQPTFQAGGSSQALTIQQNSTYPLSFYIEELVRPNVANG